MIRENELAKSHRQRMNETRHKLKEIKSPRNEDFEFKVVDGTTIYLTNSPKRYRALLAQKERHSKDPLMRLKLQKF
jgi:hypothetical protein